MKPRVALIGALCVALVAMVVFSLYVVKTNGDTPQAFFAVPPAQGTIAPYPRPTAIFAGAPIPEDAPCIKFLVPNLTPSFEEIQEKRRSLHGDEWLRFAAGLRCTRVEGWQTRITQVGDIPDTNSYSLFGYLTSPSSLENAEGGASDVDMFFTHAYDGQWKVGQQVIVTGTVTAVAFGTGTVHVVNPEVAAIER